MGLSRIFRSRWSALFWAGGVVWTAIDLAPASPPQKRPAAAAAGFDATGEKVNAADLAVLANAGG